MEKGSINIGTAKLKMYHPPGGCCPGGGIVTLEIPVNENMRGNTIIQNQLCKKVAGYSVGHERRYLKRCRERLLCLGYDYQGLGIVIDEA
jgi:hypothetical protein